MFHSYVSLRLLLYMPEDLPSVPMCPEDFFLHMPKIYPLYPCVPKTCDTFAQDLPKLVLMFWLS